MIALEDVGKKARKVLVTGLGNVPSFNLLATGKMLRAFCYQSPLPESLNLKCTLTTMKSITDIL